MARVWVTLLLLVASVGSLSSCTDTNTENETVRGSGHLQRESREVNSFHAIASGIAADLRITQSDATALEIEADDNLLPLITTTVDDGRLTIELVRQHLILKPSEPIQIHVSTPTLDGLELSGSGSNTASSIHGARLHVSLSGLGWLVLNDLATTALTAEVSGVADLRADGTAQQQSVIVSGVGSYDARDVPGSDATITISGVGHATVRVSDTLTATISGSGSVGYYGDPQVTHHITGAGTVQRLGD